ncbi:MAG: hypothetical protein EHM20_10115, partial [Alphaproteobacteria bacterium]
MQTHSRATTQQEVSHYQLSPKLAWTVLLFNHKQHQGEDDMGQEARCVNCGVNIEKDYILFINGAEFTFDSFECAV